MIQVAMLALMVTMAEIPHDGVLMPASGLQDRVTLIGSNGRSVEQITPPSEYADHLRSKLPLDDRGQWYIAVFSTPTSNDSRLLLRDIRESPELRALANWGTLKVVDFDTKANRERWKHLGVRYTPTVLVYPRPGHPQLEYKCAMAQEGYGGDAGKLARNIYSSIQTIYDRHWKGIGKNPCPGPFCPTPNPRPQPQPNQPWQPDRPNTPDNSWPSPAPVPSVPPVPNIPFNFWNMDFTWFWALVGFAFQAVVLICVFLIFLALLPKFLLWALRKFKELFREIATTVAESNKSGNGTKTRSRK